MIWNNDLAGVNQHLLPVDTTAHWCYSLHGYTKYSIAKTGIPIITHLHGGHSDFQYDGNPEFFYSPSGKKQVAGPQWDTVPEGFTTIFKYDNNVRAGNLWYHDHALGITRLNVYAGLAGFYFVRDEFDTGFPVGNKKNGNTLDLPAWPYEKAYAIQDRMFYDTGELFYPAFPGDPYYEGFITEEGAVLPPEIFPGGGPTALAEFFGDHMVVNGVIWPFENVEPRNYRMHLLNGTDSRFMAIQLIEVPAGATVFTGTEELIPFDVIGSDQGLASSPTTVTTLLSEPGSRYDIIVDFKNVTPGNRVIMKNIGGDEPFGGDLVTDDPALQVYGETDRIMAFDVVLPLDNKVPDVSPTSLSIYPPVGEPTVTRQVALFEGKDEFGRLQPLLGANTGTPAVPVWSAIPWHMPTTENPALGSTEEWEIYNFTGDAHPVHLHLIHFEILGRNEITYVSDDGDPGQEVMQHNNTYGVAPAITNVSVGAAVNLLPADGYVENAPKDMVTALPNQVTRIKATFDKSGRYVWHCHILSHEDHEMMRVLHVGPEA